MIIYENITLISSENKKILDNINLKIKKEEFFVLVGSSGSGKTTTLKLINRLIKQTEGNILFFGKRIEEYNLRELRLKIGYVLQEIALFPNLTVGENIALIPEMKRMDKLLTKNKIENLLKIVGLNPKEYINRYPKDLSGGERQRVGILRAIIGEPKILIMDEPFSALDPISRLQLQDLIKKLHNEYKMTTVFVTHDIEEAIKLGDRICVMHEGKVVQIGSSKEIKNNPKNNFIKEIFKIKEEKK